MKLTIVETDSEFQALRPAWGTLTSEPLASWEWNYSWWKNLGQNGELKIIVAENENGICGIAPFFVELRRGERKLRFLGSGSTCTDYLQTIVTTGLRSEFSAAIADEIRDNPKFRVSLIELDGVLGNPDDIQLCDELNSEFWRYDRELESTWIVQLPETWEEFVQARHRSQRRKIRKAEKRYQSGQAIAESTLDGLDFEQAFERLVELHQIRFVSQGKPGVFSNPDFKLFLQTATRSLCEKRRAEIVICNVDQRPIVAHLYLIGSNGPQLYQSGMCVDSMAFEPGHLLFAHTIKQAMKNGHSTFDFLRGNEHYKSLWGGVPCPLFKIRCVSKKVAPTLTHQMIRGLRHLKHTIADLPMIGGRGEMTT